MEEWQALEVVKAEYGYLNEKFKPMFGKEKWDLIKPGITKANAFILDIGCSEGDTVIEALKDGHIVFGIDIIPSLQKTKWKLRKIDNICFLAFADDMPFENEMFDYVLSLGVFEHIPEIGIDNTLQEINRILSSSGCLIAQIGLNPYPIKLLDTIELHCTLHTAEWWHVKLLEHGFKTESFEIGNMANPGSEWLIAIKPGSP